MTHEIVIISSEDMILLEEEICKIRRRLIAMQVIKKYQSLFSEEIWKIQKIEISNGKVVDVYF